MRSKNKITCNIAVIGAGTMGPGITQVFAQAGCPVRLVDIDEVALEQAQEYINYSIKAFEKSGVYSARKALQTLSNISFTADLAAAAREADFIVEAVGEDFKLKKALLKQVEKLAPAGAIIASNTSTFSIDDLARDSKRPGKYILTHFVNPPHVIPLVEVARGAKTSDKTYDFTLTLLKQAGKRPLILKKMIPGHLINNFNFAILSTALDFMGQGIASIKDIDRAFTEALGLRYAVMGPFKTMDLIGLNIIWQAVTAFDANAHKDPRIKKLKNLYQAGKLGMRSGAGFHDYSRKSYFDTVNYYDRKILRTYKTAREK